MEYRILTGTGLYVSPLCLGTMTFGDQVDEKSACEIIDFAVDQGINFIDTADAYSHGECETIIGKAVKGKRDKVILATKVGYPVQAERGVNDVGLSRKYILKAVEDSLKRLDTDYIDLYFMHRPVYDNPVEETLDTLSTLVRSGKVRYIGVSNQAAWQICEEIWRSSARNYIAPAVTQNGYNMISRGVEQELVPFLKQYKVGFVIYNPIAGGLLSGKHKFGAPTPNTRFDGNKMYIDRYWQEDNFKAIERLTAIAESGGMNLLELALRWCISQKHVDSMLLGTSKLEQLCQNIQLVGRGALDASILEACDGVWKTLAGNRYQYNR